MNFKEKKKNGELHKYCYGKNVALIFEKTSTRTRFSFEVAASDLGMHSTFLDPTASQIGKKESIADTARVLGRMYDGIEYRGYGQDIVEELAEYASVPVYNGLTNEFHPTQILADFMTIREHFGGLKGRKLVYMGDARYNMGNSLMVGCAKMGMQFVACAPEKYFPSADLVEQGPEARAVVHLDAVRQLVLHDVVLQMPWQQYQVEREVDAALRAAAAPSPFGRGHPDIRHGQPASLCHVEKAREEPFPYEPPGETLQSLRYPSLHVVVCQGFGRLVVADDAVSLPLHPHERHAFLLKSKMEIGDVDARPGQKATGERLLLAFPQQFPQLRAQLLDGMPHVLLPIGRRRGTQQHPVPEAEYKMPRPRIHGHGNGSQFLVLEEGHRL